MTHSVTHKVWSIIVAAGQSSRMGACKITLPLSGKPVLAHTLAAFAHTDGIILVAAPHNHETASGLFADCANALTIVYGGDTRTSSVFNGLQALMSYAQPDDIVLVQDGARPLVTGEIIKRCVESVRTYGSGVAALPLTDTIKEAEDQWVNCTLPRERLWAVHTPQGFRFAELYEAYKRLMADPKAPSATDDAGVMEWAGHAVRLVMSEPENIKLTMPQDIVLAQGFMETRRKNMPMRVGQGYDVHRLVVGRKLILCGVEIAHTMGLLGHSDADVACHALIDALLGAVGWGDIGEWFPDTDAEFENADSMELLGRVVDALKNEGWMIGNVDMTVIAQQPKLLPYKEAMRAAVAAVLGVGDGMVSVKAKTTEKLGFAGREEGIAAQCVVMLYRYT